MLPCLIKEEEKGVGNAVFSGYCKLSGQILEELILNPDFFF